MSIPANDPAAGVMIAMLCIAIALLYMVKRLGRARPGFTVGKAIAVAFAVRLIAVVAINATGLGASLRGGDEDTFLFYASQLAVKPLGTAFLPHGGEDQLHVVLFALQIKLGFINVTSLRITQIGISLLGYLFMLAATYDLAGARATRFAAWCLTFEPSSLFFNSEIHKEPLMELAAGLCALGGVWIWKRLDLRGVLVCVLGCGIGVETRSYAGWFLAGGCVLVILHASLRNTRRKGTAVALIYAVVIAGMIAAPTLLSATSGKNLKQLQASQGENSTGYGQNGGSNLALEQVDISTRGKLITSLPTKIRELLLEPYPWQLHDSSQAFGSLGTLVAYAVIAMLLRYGWLLKGDIFARCGPLIYPLLFELLAYSVTVGNAGTGFRYRSHLVTLGICTMAILREGVRARKRPATDPGDEPAGDVSGREFQPLPVLS